MGMLIAEKIVAELIKFRKGTLRQSMKLGKVEEFALGPWMGPHPKFRENNKAGVQQPYTPALTVFRSQKTAYKSVLKLVFKCAPRGSQFALRLN